MKQIKRHTSKAQPTEEEPEHGPLDNGSFPDRPSYKEVTSKKDHKERPRQQRFQSGNHAAQDKEQLAFEIEVGICEVDKIFEGQGDKLSDAFVIESLDGLARLIKETTYEKYADKLKGGSDDESDMLHINIVNRLGSIIEELEMHVTDGEIVSVIHQILSRVKKLKSEKSLRAYLDPLAKRLKEMGFKSEFLTETSIDDQTIRLEDIDNLDDLSLDDDDLDLDDLRPRY